MSRPRQPFPAACVLLALTFAALPQHAGATLPDFTSGFRSLLTRGAPRTIQVADLNSDGWVDLVSACGDSATIFLGTGGGGFALSQRLWIANRPLPYDGSFGVGDMDGDGHLDLVFPNSGGAGVVVYVGDGSGLMRTSSEYPTGSGPSSVALADFNLDGRLDVATANITAKNLSILLGTESGALGAKTDIAAGQSPGFVSSGDLNGDGTPDLMVASSNSPVLTPLIGNGNGTFDIGITPVGDEGAFTLGDVNLDGNVDLVRAGYALSVSLGHGDGTFELPVDLPHSPPSWGIHSVVLGDLNGDGLPDLAAAAPGEDYTAFPPPNRRILAYLGRGDGSFGAEIVVGTAGGPTSVVIADLSGDAIADVAVSGFASLVVSLHFGNGNGTFGDVRHYGVGSNPVSIQAADFNGDGHADVATANPGDGTLSVLLGQADGGLGSRQDHTVGPEPIFVATGDMDGDGRPDLIACRRFILGGEVVALLGQGDGRFSATPEVLMRTTPVEAVVADFNEDDIQDVVIGSGWISVLAGIGAGALGPAVTIEQSAIGDPYGTVWAGDFNNDGHTDVAYVAPTPSPTDHVVCVRLGNGDGTFGDRSEISVPGIPISIVGGDLNHDGYLDIVAVGHWNLALSLLGRGDGSFTPGKTFAIPAQPTIARLGDLNGDGILDLVTASWFSNLVAVFLGRGNGDFEDAVGFGAGLSPVGVTLDDFNGDGLVDIAVANGGDSTVSLLLNRTPGSGPLAATATLRGALVVGAGKPIVCVDVESIGDTFSQADVQPSDVHLTSRGTGSVPSIQGQLEDTAPEPTGAFGVCFSREDLARLFDRVRSKRTVAASVDGTLKDGRRFHADLSATVVPARGRLSAALAPNPTNPSSILSFATTRRGSIRVDVIDVQGRVVRTVAQTSQAPAGYHAHSVGTRARSDERIASGIYFLRIATQFDGNETLRFVVLK